jgi:hypothetical protein
MVRTVNRVKAANYPDPPELDRIRKRALMIGAVVGIACIAGAFMDPTQFFRSYLVGFLFWIGIPLGSLAIAMLHHLTGGAWGLVVRRIFEAASRTLPLMALLFLPLLFGLSHVYVWAQPGWGESAGVMARKSAYLNPIAFGLRALVYFALLGTLVFLINRWSLEQDRTGDHSLQRKMRRLAAPGLAVYCLGATFASIDWLMSLDPHWASSIHGVSFVGGQALSALAFVVPVAFLLGRRPPLGGVLASRHFSDYGNLMLAFLMLWAYFSVSQLIIIWSGNLPEEIPWYLTRMGGPWHGMGLVLVLGHFAVPFLLLLSRGVKQNARLLSLVALLVLLMRWVDLQWQAVPAFHPQGPVWHWLDLAVFVAMGALWTAFFVRQLGQRSLLPVHDPQLAEALAHD